MSDSPGIGMPERGASRAEAAGPGRPDAAGELLRRAARGDEDAFAALYDLVSAQVHGLVLRVVRDPAQAEEVTQECFLDLWRSATRFDPATGTGIGWILSISHRRAVDRVRSAQAATDRDAVWARTTHEVDHDSTVEGAVSSLEAERVRAALGTLTAAQRESIELAYFGGYSHTEVAGLLDLPLGTAKTRIRDGLIRLRDALGVEP